MAKGLEEIVLEPRRETPGGVYEVRTFGLSAAESIAARKIANEYVEKMRADVDKAHVLVLELCSEFCKCFGGQWYATITLHVKCTGPCSTDTFQAFPISRKLCYMIPGVTLFMLCMLPTSDAPKDKSEEEIKVVAKKEAYAQCKDATRSKGNKMKRANGLRCFCRRLALSKKTLKFAGKN